METATDWSELQVPGEPGVWCCARHKNTHTRLRCGRCEKPICPKCTVMAPTGARCHDCVSNRTAHMYQVAPRHMALAFGASLLAGVIGLAVIGMLDRFWIWGLLYAPVVGPLLGRLVTQITGGKRGPKIAMVVSLGLFIGAVASSIISEWALMNSASTMMREMGEKVPAMPVSTALILTMAFANPALWIFLVLAIGGVWWWLK